MNDPVVKLSDCNIVKCSNCNKDLLIIKNYKPDDEKIKQFNLPTNLQVDCPFCGDHSFIHESKGTFGYHPAIGVKITNYTVKNNTMKFSTSK